MTYRPDVEIVEPAPVYADPGTRVVRYRAGPAAMLERVLVLIFSLIGVVIGLRILLLLLAAREGNNIVQLVYNVSEIFVAPFRGILSIKEVQAGVATLDFGAVVALVGWLIIALIVIAIVRMFRPAAVA